MCELTEPFVFHLLLLSGRIALRQHEEQPDGGEMQVTTA